MLSKELVGERVKYTISKEETIDGLIVSEILLFDKSVNRTVTGFMVQNKEGKIYSIPHWRIKEIIN